MRERETTSFLYIPGLLKNFDMSEKLQGVIFQIDSYVSVICMFNLEKARN